jgi:hypothetical protein
MLDTERLNEKLSAYSNPGVLNPRSADVFCSVRVNFCNMLSCLVQSSY